MVKRQHLYRRRFVHPVHPWPLLRSQRLRHRSAPPGRRLCQATNSWQSDWLVSGLCCAKQRREGCESDHFNRGRPTSSYQAANTLLDYWTTGLLHCCMLLHLECSLDTHIYSARAKQRTAIGRLQPWTDSVWVTEGSMIAYGCRRYQFLQGWLAMQPS